MTIHTDRIVHGPGTKSDKIRALSAAGMSRADIARALGIRYQHVRNVLVGDEQAGRTPADVAALAEEAAAKPVAETREPTFPGGPAKMIVGEGGIVVLPVEAIEKLGIRPGSVLSARVVDDELRICTHAVAIRRLQERFRQSVNLPDGVSLVDELIAERRREAAREFGDDDERS